jgi:hypothetical protein
VNADGLGSSLRPALRSPLQPLRSSLAAGFRYGSVTGFARWPVYASGDFT